MIILAGLVGSLSLSSLAATNKHQKETSSAVQYVGTTEKGIVFNVKFDNADASKFDLIIKNEYGDVVYQQEFSDKNFDKKVLLMKEPGEAHLTFIIKTPSESYKQSFDISTVTRTVEDVVVTNAK